MYRKNKAVEGSNEINWKWVIVVYNIRNVLVFDAANEVIYN